MRRFDRAPPRGEICGAEEDEGDNKEEEDDDKDEEDEEDDEEDEGATGWWAGLARGSTAGAGTSERGVVVCAMVPAAAASAAAAPAPATADVGAAGAAAAGAAARTVGAGPGGVSLRGGVATGLGARAALAGTKSTGASALLEVGGGDVGATSCAGTAVGPELSPRPAGKGASFTLLSAS